MAAGAFDDAGGDRPAGCQGLGVVEVGLFGVQVVQGLADDLLVLAAGFGWVFGGQLLDVADDVGGLAVEDVQRLGDHPVFHRRVAGGVEAPGGFPQVFQHVDEVDQDGDGDSAGGGLGLDQADLVDVAVHQRDPGPAVAWVAAFGFVEDLADGVLAAGGDVGGVPAVHRARRVLSTAWFWAHDLFGAARWAAGIGRLDVEHAPDLSHPLVPFLPGAAPVGEGLG